MLDQLTVHTMKDDIAEMNALPKVTSPVPAPVPIPPQSTGIVSPKRKHQNIAIGIGYSTLFFLVVSGTIYAYMRWNNVLTVSDTVSQEATFFQLIPKEALAVVDYNLETEENKSAVRQMWGQREESDFSSAVSGNPTDLLDISELSHVYYVVMPGSDTPFLVIKKTDAVKEYIAEQSGVQFMERGGWFILHASNLERYTEALGEGAIAENSTLLSIGDSIGYLVRYAMSPSFVSQQFNAMASTTIGTSQLDGLVFHILTPGSDGTMSALAHVAGNPPGEGVPAQTGELLALIPGDVTFGRVGVSFTEELNTLLGGETPAFDTALIAQPAIRQFLSLFTTPYVIFERKGTDGVRDIGLIVALPDSLRQKVRAGEPIIEQALPALIPLIVGKTLGIQVTFHDGEHNGVALRYVNINGQTQTLDYSVGDNYLLISSSREGISALIDTSLAQKNNLFSADPWKKLGLFAGPIENKPLVIGSISESVMKNILPTPRSLEQVPIVISSQKTSTGVDIQAVLLSE